MITNFDNSNARLIGHCLARADALSRSFSALQVGDRIHASAVIQGPIETWAKSGAMTNEEEQGLYRAVIHAGQTCKRWEKGTTRLGQGGVWITIEEPLPRPEFVPKWTGRFFLMAFIAPSTYVYAHFEEKPTPEMQCMLDVLTDAVHAHISCMSELTKTLNEEREKARQRASSSSSYDCSGGPTLSRGDMFGIANAIANGCDVYVRRDVLKNTFG